MSDFPASPELEETFVTADDITWKWNGTSWVPQSNPDGKTLGNQISIAPGQIQTENIANNSITASKLNSDVSTTIMSASPPASPSVGDLWCDSANGELYIYYDSFWVQITKTIP